MNDKRSYQISNNVNELKLNEELANLNRYLGTPNIKDGVPNYLQNENSNKNSSVNKVSTSFEGVVLPDAGKHPVLPDAGKHPVLPDAGSFFTNAMSRTRQILTKELGEQFVNENYGKIYEKVETNSFRYNKFYNFIIENYSDDLHKSEKLRSYIDYYIYVEVLSYALILKQIKLDYFNILFNLIIEPLFEDKKNNYAGKSTYNMYLKNYDLIQWVVKINKIIRKLMKTIIWHETTDMKKIGFEMNLANDKVNIDEFSMSVRIAKLKSGGFKKSIKIKKNKRSKKSKKSKKGKKSRKSKTNKKLIKNNII